MDRHVSRRSFLQLTSALGVGAVGIGTQVTSVEAVSDRYIVDTSTADGSGWRGDVEVIHDLSEIDIAVVRGSEDDLGSLKYSRDFEMEVEPPITVEDDHTASGDSLSALQWDKQAQNAFELHADGYTGDGAKVAIIDSGIDPDHPDLAPNLNEEESANMTEDGGDYSYTSDHGTHVAGIAAAADNEEGIVGVAPDAEIVAIRVFGEEGGANFGDVLFAIYYAAMQGCDAANLSLGAYPIPSGLDARILEESFDRAVAFGRDEGCVTVVSAGNTDANLDNDADTLNLPTESEGTVRVSATGPQGFGYTLAGLASDVRLPTHAPSRYTNYGAEATTVSAAGGNYDPEMTEQLDDVPVYAYDLVFSTVPRGWGWMAGTSMAAPQVAGLVALVSAENPDASVERIKYHIEWTADHIIGPDYSAAEYFQPDAEVAGYGIGNGMLEDAYDSETYRGSGHINVEQAATAPIPFPTPIEVDGYTIAPRDPDGDGRFEDVNGDGKVDIDDVHALFELFMSGASLSPAEEMALDFDGDGGFDQFDVQALLDEVRA